MSTASRLISGSVAQWAQIGVTVIAQVLLVPIYLTHWSVEKYGIWLAVQGIMAALSMLDMGYQSYMSFEFLRLVHKDIPLLSKSLWSAVVIGIMVSLTQILIIVGVAGFGAMPLLLGAESNSDLVYQATVALFLQGLTWLIIMTVPGLIVRALAGFGYFPRMAWWGFSYAIIAAVAPITAVVLGGGLLHASLALFVCSMIYTSAHYFEIFRLLKKERLRFVRPSLALGFRNFTLSLPLLGKSLLESVRQQGVRLVLAPLSGAVGLAAFSTMRTGANVALQGLNTVIHPLLPDLMRFLHDRDQPRSEAAFSVVWVVVVFGLAPGIVLLQAIIGPFFVFWTQGKITFDPLLFATLSLGVLIYAVIQPAMAVVVGNNLTRIQLGIAAVAAVTVLLFMGMSVPVVGIVGAGFALLLAELAAAAGYYYYACKWLKNNGLVWPALAFRLASRSVGICAVALVAMVGLPDQQWLVAAVALMLLGWNGWKYWRVLPPVAIASARNAISKVPLIHRLIPNEIV